MNPPPHASSTSVDNAVALRQAIKDVACSKKTETPLRDDVGKRFKALGSSIPLAKACSRYSALVVLGGIGPTAWIALREQDAAPALSSHEPAPTSKRHKALRSSSSHQPVLISDVPVSGATIEKCIADFEASPSAYAVAVDLEGERIGPAEGRLAIVTVCTPDKRVFLFDIAAMGAAAFDAGMLRVLLEHPKLPKLWFDCRADVAELHKYKVKPQNVVDLQVGAVKQLWPSSPHLVGLAKTLDKMKLVSAAEARIKEAGKKLFAPEEGGAYRVFFDRPMDPIVAQYCAVDVVHLFDMRSQLLSYETLSCTVGAKRVDRSATTGFTCGKHMAEKDFA